MATHLTQPCNSCGGSGRVPRPHRRLPNGEPDRFDTIQWPEIVCDACNGAGEVPLHNSSIQEKAPVL